MTGPWSIGVDGGGTKTAIAAARVGQLSADIFSEAGPCNIAIMEPEAAMANVVLALNNAGIEPAEVASLCCGVAGYSAVAKRAAFISLLKNTFFNAEIRAVPDYIVAHSGAFADQVGVTVIAGTGSIAYGSNGRGDSTVRGGYGYIIDDHGTGYGLGRQALAAIGRVFDGSAEKTLLFEIVCERVGIRSRGELITAVYGGPLDRASIAALAPLVADAASAGDTVATGLLMHAGGALARIAEAALHPLFLPDQPVKLSRTGSLWSAGGELTSVFERSLSRSHPAIEFITSSEPPTVGALRIAQSI